MKKASSSFLIFVFAVLLVSFQSFAQIASRPEIQERVARHLRAYERLRLSDLLRLSHQEMHLEVRSLSVMAESLMNGQASLQLLHLGRLVGSEVVRKNPREIRMMIPAMARLSELELSVSSDIFIDTVRAEVIHQGQHYPSPYPEVVQPVRPNQMITLQINQHVRGRTQLPLRQLVRQQLGLALEGAEIERVVVQADPVGSRAASVQVELNGRLVGPLKYIDRSVERMPLPVERSEEVRSLQLVINGDAFVQTVGIRVGRVRPAGPQYPQSPQSQRVLVNRQIAPHMGLELSSVLGYDSRLVQAVTIEARSVSHLQSQIQLIGAMSFQGTIMVGSGTARATIRLSRPLMAYELRLEARSPAIIQALEVEFVR